MFWWIHDLWFEPYWWFDSEPAVSEPKWVLEPWLSWNQRVTRICLWILGPFLPAVQTLASHLISLTIAMHFCLLYRVLNSDKIMKVKILCNIQGCIQMQDFTIIAMVLFVVDFSPNDSRCFHITWRITYFNWVLIQWLNLCPSHPWVIFWELELPTQTQHISKSWWWGKSGCVCHLEAAQGSLLGTHSKSALPGKQIPLASLSPTALGLTNGCT